MRTSPSSSWITSSGSPGRWTAPGITRTSSGTRRTASSTTSSISPTDRRSGGGVETFQSDPHWRAHLLFYEYFHGDNGAGIGASHQTGWTGLVARFIQLFGSVDGPGFLKEAVTVALNRGQ